MPAPFARVRWSTWPRKGRFNSRIFASCRPMTGFAIRSSPTWCRREPIPSGRWPSCRPRRWSCPTRWPDSCEPCRRPPRPPETPKSPAGRTRQLRRRARMSDGVGNRPISPFRRRSVSGAGKHPVALVSARRAGHGHRSHGGRACRFGSIIAWRRPKSRPATGWWIARFPRHVAAESRGTSPSRDKARRPPRGFANYPAPSSRTPPRLSSPIATL